MRKTHLCPWQLRKNPPTYVARRNLYFDDIRATLDRRTHGLGDIVNALLGADLRLRSKKRKRTVAARDFFLGTFETAMEADELLIDIELPGPHRSGGSAYVSFKQPASGYAMAGAAVVIKTSRSRIKECALAFTGVSYRAFVANTDGLIDSKGETELVAEVARQALDGVDVASDIHAPADYRRHLASMAAARAITAAVARAR